MPSPEAAGERLQVFLIHGGWQGAQRRLLRPALWV
jgi:hypothetical protein